MNAVAAPTLARALDVAAGIVKGGWTRGAYCRSSTGEAVATRSSNIARVDLAYALELAAEAEGFPASELRAAVEAELPEPYRSDTTFGVERWNDMEYRSKTQVLMLLRRAAARSR